MLDVKKRDNNDLRDGVSVGVKRVGSRILRERERESR